MNVVFLFKGGSSGPRPPSVGPCSPNPCQNGALCRPRGDGYSCFCVPGFQGPRCQIDVNECASQPCRSGATCLDGRGRFSCLCPPGLTGEWVGVATHRSQVPRSTRTIKTDGITIIILIFCP